MLTEPRGSASPLRLLVEPPTSSPEPERAPTIAEALAAYRSVWTRRALCGRPPLRLVTRKDDK